MIEFYNKLKDPSRATPKQQKEELWDVEGVLHNQKFKFDLRPLKNNAKAGSFNTKADKIVYDLKNRYVIVDVEELHNYVKENSLKIVKIEDLISKLDWNIILSK